MLYTWFWISCSICRQRIIITTDDSSKIMDIISRTLGCCGQAADEATVYSQVEMEDIHKLLKIPKSECPDIWIRLLRHMAKIIVQYGRPSCSSWKESVRSSFGRTVMGKAISEHPIETWLGENSKLGMSLCASWKRIILICVCGWHQIGWKETKSWPNVESTQQRSRFGRTNIFLLHSTTMQNKQRCCGQVQNPFESRISAGGVENYYSPKIFVFLHGLYDMIGHAKKCVERCCELANKTTQQLYKVSTPCIDDHFKENEIRERIVKSMLSNCSEMLLVSTYWTTWYSHGQCISLHDPSQNGPRPVRNAWIDFDLVFISRVNTDNIVKWVILPNNADWDCFKTLILREILKIRLEEHCAFLEVIHLFQ